MKAPSKLIWLAYLIGLFLLFPAPPVYADIGPPPPAMDFVFEFQGQPIPMVGWQLIHCDDAACLHGERAAEAQLFCHDQQCESTGIAQGYAEYQKLIITFSDKTRESNSFSRLAFSAKYIVTVNENDLYVQEVFPESPFDYFSTLQLLGFPPALVLTLLTESIVAILFSKLIKTPVKWVGAANLLSLPIVWFIFPFLSNNTILVFLMAEIFAIGFEAVFFYIVNKRTHLSLKYAGLTSLIINLSSVTVGIVAMLLLIAAIEFLL